MRRFRELRVPGMDCSNALFYRRVIQRDTDRAQRRHLRLAERRDGTAAQPARDHSPDRHQLMTLQRHVQLSAASRQLLLHHQTYRRRALQGDEIQRQQLFPCKALLARQRGLFRHDSNKPVEAQRGKQQVVRRCRFKGDAHLDSPLPHHLNHLLVDNVMHGNVDPGMTIAKRF